MSVDLNNASKIASNQTRIAAAGGAGPAGVALIAQRPRPARIAHAGPRHSAASRSTARQTHGCMSAQKSNGRKV